MCFQSIEWGTQPYVVDIGMSYLRSEAENESRNLFIPNLIKKYSASNLSDTKA